MKKLSFIFLFAPLFFSFFWLDLDQVSAGSCRTIGSTTYCDDGTSYRSIGSTVYGSDGTSYRTIGNTTYGSNGTNWSSIGSTVYGSDGTSYRTIGNTTYSSGGYNTFSTCPSNSTKNFNGECTCNSGYVASGGKCTYKSPYTSSFGGSLPDSSYSGSSYMSKVDCPAHATKNSNGTCSCDFKYKFNSAKNKCVKLTKKDNDKSCQEDFGKKSEWNGEYDNEDEVPWCVCKKNYDWSEKGDICVKE